MRRIVAARSLGLVLACAGMAGAQDAPPVEAPAPAELPPVLQARPIPGTGPVLAVPGTGGATSRYSRMPSTVAPTVPGIEMPPLVGPAEGMNTSEGTGNLSLPPWAGTGSAYGRTAPPVSLETIPDGTMSPFPNANPDGGMSPNPNFGLDRARRAPLTPPPPPVTSRRPRLFGRWQPPLLRGRPGAQPDETISVEPRSDPAADAALKRRIEQQVDLAVGTKLKSLDVKVVDRDVTIRARVSRFWFRRGVKHTIESLPTLAGYRTNIEVVD